MLRIVLGVIAGFFAWMIVWVGSEKILSAIWPAFGTMAIIGGKLINAKNF